MTDAYQLSPGNDTHPEIENKLISMLRNTPISQKFKMMLRLNHTMRTIALAGLRERYPEASEAELRRRLADRLLGDDLAEAAYGPRSSSSEDKT